MRCSNVVKEPRRTGALNHDPSDSPMALMFDRLKAVSSRTRDALRQAQAQLAQAAGYGLMNHHIFTDYAERSLLLQGRLAARTNPVERRIADLSEAEFCVFSQWGEDGIIEWLVAHVDTPNARFVEFGVETFREANCRFLMQNRNWKGLVLDGSEANMAALRTQPLFWKHHLETHFCDAATADGALQAARLATTKMLCRTTESAIGSEAEDGGRTPPR